MFKIDSSTNAVTLTRGDTAVFSLNLNNYEAQDGDVIVMTVKKRIVDKEPLLTKYAEGKVIVFEPEDTINLLGKCVYDIQITTALGAVYTPILSTITFERGVTE